jgi:hypothetical protein
MKAYGVNFTSEALAILDALNIVPGITPGHNKPAQIPKEFLTEKNLRTYDADGDTVFHHAAMFGNLHRIPKELLTPENLSLTNHAGETVLDITIRNNSYYQIPITPKLIPLLSNKFSLIQAAALAYKRTSSLPERVNAIRIWLVQFTKMQLTSPTNEIAPKTARRTDVSEPRRR